MINVSMHERQSRDLPDGIPPFKFKSSVLSNQLGAYLSITDSTHCDVTIYFRTCETIALFREALVETEELLGSVGGKPYKVTNRSDALQTSPLASILSVAGPQTALPLMSKTHPICALTFNA